MPEMHWIDRLGAVVRRWAARGALARLPVTRERLVSRLEGLGANDTLADAPDFRLYVLPGGLVRCVINGFTVAHEWRFPADRPLHSQPARPGRRGASPETLAKARARAAHTTALRVRDHDARCLPTIRRLRARGCGWRRIAGALAREGIDPPGRRAGHPESGWLAPAVLRIARCHGIA